jgi:hypothetical protein
LAMLLFAPKAPKEVKPKPRDDEDLGNHTDNQQDERSHKFFSKMDERADWIVFRRLISHGER